ncbi:esterase/lipase family protein [Streptomyces sp. NRRL S-350]|uniref:esterase/lipase family protein n=1 Tax=Streptomyces sp. NRRL S-350 TaxID=1463902 RepID=UPI000AE99131|nr:alpha/beta hydrolase [Streptomyces sp. NRRL S-350]
MVSVFHPQTDGETADSPTLPLPPPRGPSTAPRYAADGVARLPLIYVRGFAGGTAGIDKQVDDPFYGFNDGSTHIRVGGDGNAQYYQFESPLLRLFAEDGYHPLVAGDPKAYLRSCEAASVDPATVWIHRFYDASADTFSKGAADFDIEAAARDLYELVRLVREKTGSDKVDLIAHSMGGLVCRSMLQKWSYDSFGDFHPTIPGKDLVDRLFTYGTPHGGITFAVGGGLLDEFMEDLGPVGSDIFSPEKMYGYLVPGVAYGTEAPEGWQPDRIPPEAFDPDRVFCVIGTDPGDYGPARKVVGPQSDGLVTIRNACVEGAHRAYVHRSHSGRYGLVNSEEGYQNLRRFLFGRKRVAIELAGLEPGPPDVDGRRTFRQAEVQLSVRGLPVVLHQQLAAHYCPVGLEPGPDGAPVPLTTVFLLDPLTVPADGTDAPVSLPSRYALHLRVSRLAEEHGLLFWRDHLAQTADWDDTLIVDVGHESDDPKGELRLWAVWNSQLPVAIADRDPAASSPLDPGLDAVTVPLPPSAGRLLGPDAALVLRPAIRD